MEQTERTAPGVDAWLREAKASPDAARVGMYLIHNGVVREDARARVRGGEEDAPSVQGMRFSHDAQKVRQAEEETLRLPGIYYVRTWLNKGTLQVGDDLMQVLIGGDIRPHVLDALDFLVGTLKRECVTEQELY